MPREELPSVQDVAQQVLREVDAENRIKVAEQQILRGVLNPKVKTDLGYDLMKLATQCAKIDEEPTITTDDLVEFVARCNRAR